MKQVLIFSLALLAGCRSNAAETKTAANTPAPSTPAATPAASTPARPGDTRVARWKDDKKAAFLLMFDDGWPSHWQVAVPELRKRGLTATFYIVPNKGEFKMFLAEWKKIVAAGDMTLGNHTWNHDGFQGTEDSEKEITDTTKFLYDFVPGKTPRLMSFALPGVKDYNYGDTDLKTLLAKNNLIDRGDFKGHGAVYHLQKTEQMLALADKAIADGGMEYLVIHGVERITPNWGYQDFWALKQDVFLPLLDGLKDRADRGDLWITDHISEYKYATERDSATVRVLQPNAKTIRLELKDSADPQLYDLPLTLIAQVPAKWTNCVVTQGATKSNAVAANGVLRFDALPNGGPISIQPA